MIHVVALLIIIRSSLLYCTTGRLPAPVATGTVDASLSRASRAQTRCTNNNEKLMGRDWRCATKICTHDCTNDTSCTLLLVHVTQRSVRKFDLLLTPGVSTDKYPRIRTCYNITLLFIRLFDRKRSICYYSTETTSNHYFTRHSFLKSSAQPSYRGHSKRSVL
jgi:hypothetical protein